MAPDVAVVVLSHDFPAARQVHCFSVSFRDVGAKIVFVGAEHPGAARVGAHVGLPHCTGRLRY